MFRSRYIDRDFSWLSFNGRVLQEAMDPTVPLFERINFLAIFSSNLDEFFRVRVAALRSQLVLQEEDPDADLHVAKRLWQIQETVTAQQERFGEIFRSEVLPALKRHGIVLSDERSLHPAQLQFVHTYFEQYIRPYLSPVFLDGADPTPFLKNKQLYLVVTCWPHQEASGAPAYALVQIPSPPLPRFLEVPGEEGRHRVLFLDDAVRLNLPALFPDYEVGSSYAVKLSRDAELYLDEEIEGDLIEKLKQSLLRRDVGAPCRFLYDLTMPFSLATHLKERFELASEDMILGGRYHNFNDLFSFPRFGMDALANDPLPPLPHPELAPAASLLEATAEGDRLLHFPYQSFTYVTRFLSEAAHDPGVEEIWITLYRVASGSAVTRALIEAARQGKRVTAFVELKARFDEEPNLHWAEQMEAAGVRVLYSMPRLKVHAKIALVLRREPEGQRAYAYLGTGNFNEKTARLYADHGLLTADPRLTEEIRRVFGFLSGDVAQPAFEHLLVAPTTLRKGFYRLIDTEIEHARAGRPSGMILKMNSLEDEHIIARLYEASQAGVPIRLIVRGIYRLVPGLEGLSENIYATSIIDRFLEHARVYIFHNGGDERYYLASADWMKRNLNRRVEVAFPIYDTALRRELRALIDLQLADNTKARILDAGQQNPYVPRGDAPPVRAQIDTYRLLEAKVAVGVSNDQ